MSEAPLKGFRDEPPQPSSHEFQKEQNTHFKLLARISLAGEL